jgi:hypothetical protein
MRPSAVAEPTGKAGIPNSSDSRSKKNLEKITAPGHHARGRQVSMLPSRRFYTTKTDTVDKVG